MNPVTLAQARENLRNELSRRQLEHERRMEALYTRLPELRRLDILMRTTMIDGLTAVLRENLDPAEAVGAAARENLDAQEKRAELLAREGIDPKSAEPPVLCPRCMDRLSAGGAACVCVTEEAKKLQLASLRRKLDMERMSFERFNLNDFSEAADGRRIMGKLCENLSAYANAFDSDSKSLILDDDYAKLGKSFFCASVMNRVSRKGCWVEYDPASRLLAVLEAEKFDRLRESDGDPRRYYECGLLVIDDLGMEYVTAFAKAALYELISVRLSERRPTIINSPLTFDELGSRYTPQLSSRIHAGYMTSLQLI